MAEKEICGNDPIEMTDEELEQSSGAFGSSTDVIFKCPSCGYSRQENSHACNAYQECPFCHVRMLPHPMPL